jgi:hypothetical protein
MKRLFLVIALFGLWGAGINLGAHTLSTSGSQTSQSTQNPSTANPDSSVPQAQTDTTKSQPSARAFEGKIQKAGDELVLRESVTQSFYKLDDQNRAKKFEGRDVRVMATIDPSTNKLHVVDIMRVDTQ